MNRRLGTAAKRILSFGLPVAAGVVLLAVIRAGGDTPERTEGGERSLAVRAIEAQAVAVRPRTVAYGTVEPGESWDAVTQVSGQVVNRHDGLKPGAVIDAGQILFEIAPARYRLNVARAEAAVERANADLAELDQREANARALLAIERRSLELARKDYERTRTLQSRGTVSESALEDAERAVNQGRARVQELENELALVPAKRTVLEAEKARQRTEARLAELDLSHTTVRAPFTGRVAREEVSVGQALTTGQSVLTLDSVDRAEIEAEVPVARMLTLFNADRFGALGPLSEARVAEALGAAGIEATVRLRSGERVFEWPGRFVRLRAGLDPVARTVGAVVAVDDPYAAARPGERPPLVKNMYVEVELTGPARTPMVVVPRGAVREGAVLVADDDGRLRRRPVEVAFEQGTFAAIAKGVDAGDRVVLSDVRPAIEGRKLTVEIDREALDRAIRQATGEGPVR